MSFMFPRTISIGRPDGQSGEGVQGYGGASQAAEVPVASGVACNIELRREGQRNTSGLPGDGTRPTYDVRIPPAALAKGVVKDLDILTDDEGLRYQVVGPNWSPLGYALRVELMRP